MAAVPGDAHLAARLNAALKGEVMFDAFTRGRYSTDASIYEIEPLGVVVPRDKADIEATLAIARAEGVPVLARGGGTSQCGQTVNRALVVDCSKYMTSVLRARHRGKARAGGARRRARPAQPTAQARRACSFRSTSPPASRATIGGMTANNSCGARSLRYGNMVHNVRAIDAILADGTPAHFGPSRPAISTMRSGRERYRDLVRGMRALHRREADEIAARFPKLLRRVGGYNIDMIDDAGHNMAHLLVGSEGTLAFFTAIELDLQPIPSDRVLGICHFPSFHGAMAATKAIVALGPSAVELVDRTMIDLSRDIAMFRPIVERFVEGCARGAAAWSNSPARMRPRTDAASRALSS